MFSPGTKIYLHSSSFSGKKLGPKRHSLGYVSSVGTTMWSLTMPNFPIPKQTFIFCPLSVVFSRYGKSKTERCETRKFLQIMPIISRYGNSDQIKEAIKILQTDQFRREGREWFIRFIKHSPGKIDHLGLALPTGVYGRRHMIENDFRCWLMSILRNSNFRNQLSMHRDLPALKALVNNKIINSTDLLVWLLNASVNSDARNDLFQWTDTPSHRYVITETVRKIQTTFNKRAAALNKDPFVKYLPASLGEKEAMLHWLLKFFFDTDEILAQKVAFINTHKLEENMEVITNNLLSTRSVYIDLKPKHV